MAKKSKTQRAKHLLISAAKKKRAKQAEVTPVVEEESKKRFGFGKNSSSTKAAAKATSSQNQPKKADAKPKKKRFAFLSAVRSEMRRVTWPHKAGRPSVDWRCCSGFAVLWCLRHYPRYWVVTPILLAISSLSGLGA